MSERVDADVTIVGAGIAGLWTAKELIDQGLRINIVEKSSVLADGATTRNEGWLHAGTYHSVGIEDVAEIKPVTHGIIWGHKAVMEYAPESIDGGQTFALVLSDELAHKATSAWNQADVAYREITKAAIPENENIAKGRLRAIFSVDDKSVNSRVLCQKLASHVLDRGARIFTEAAFIPVDDATAHVNVGEACYSLRSSRFIVTAGTGVKDIAEIVTGRVFPARFFKAHSLLFPRLTANNYFHLEAGEAGFMNHGQVGIAAVNRDGIELPSPDYSVVWQKEQLAYDALSSMLPSVRRYAIGEAFVGAIACNKPDINDALSEVQSLDVKIFELSSGYIAALPGKMTTAPYLAKRLAEMILTSTSKTLAPNLQSGPAEDSPVTVALRPADQWMSERKSHTSNNVASESSQ